MALRFQLDINASDPVVLAHYLKTLAASLEANSDLEDSGLLGQDSDRVGPGDHVLGGEHNFQYWCSLEDGVSSWLDG